MTGAGAARILIADDHAVVRAGLTALIDREPDLEVVAEAEDGRKALQLGLNEQIDLAILDIAMPGLTGLQATREIRRKRELPILILSMYDREQYFFEAIAAGAAGYVLKRQVDQDIIEACRAALRGQPFIYPRHSAPSCADTSAWSTTARTPVPDPSPPERPRSSSSSRRDTTLSRSPTSLASASRRWTGTAPTSWRSST